MKALVFSTCIVILSALSGVAHAGANFVAAGCTPDPSAIQNNLYLTTAGSVKFAAGKTGDIILYCPIANPGSAPGHLWLVYYDGSGGLDAGHVIVTYYRMSTSNGAISEASHIDSDGAACAVVGSVDSCDFAFTDSVGYNTSSYYYYVRVDITRSDDSWDEIFYGATLY